MFLLVIFASIGLNAQAGLLGKQEGLETIGGSFGATEGKPGVEMYDIILKVISFLLGFVGILLTILILVAGYKWMTANGDEKKVSEAKGRIRDAVVGLVIVLCAYIIADWVIEKIATNVQGS